MTRGVEHGQPRATVTVDGMQPMVLVVGDLINFSTVSEHADQHLLAREVGSLYGALRELLPRYHGTLLNYMGDAFFAGWELDSDPEGVDRALGFAVEAAQCVARSTAAFELRYADRSPLRMGWAVTAGPVVIHLMPGSVVTAIGDGVNVAFRIASISGREGLPEILATEEVRQAARGSWVFKDAQTVSVKGRVGTVTIHGVIPG
jgi:adenylate cyclase